MSHATTTKFTQNEITARQQKTSNAWDTTCVC